MQWETCKTGVKGRHIVIGCDTDGWKFINLAGKRGMVYESKSVPPMSIQSIGLNTPAIVRWVKKANDTSRLMVLTSNFTDKRKSVFSYITHKDFKAPILVDQFGRALVYDQSKLEFLLEHNAINNLPLDILDGTYIVRKTCTNKTIPIPANTPYIEEKEGAYGWDRLSLSEEGTEYLDFTQLVSGIPIESITRHTSKPGEDQRQSGAGKGDTETRQGQEEPGKEKPEQCQTIEDTGKKVYEGEQEQEGDKQEELKEYTSESKGNLGELSHSLDKPKDRPEELSDEPGGIGLKPGEEGTKPDELEVKSDDINVKPGVNDTDPSDSDIKLGEEGTKPGELEVNPSDISDKPEDSEIKPGDKKVKLEDSGNEPGDSGDKPEGSKDEPGDINDEPTYIKSKLEEVNHKPGEERAKLDESKAKPGDYADELGEERAKLDESKAKPDGSRDKPTYGKTEPEDSGDKPTDRNIEPGEERAKPGDSEDKPSNIENRLDEVSDKPEVSEVKPGEEKAKPTDSSINPEEPKDKPEKEKAEPEGLPVIPVNTNNNPSKSEDKQDPPTSEAPLTELISNEMSPDTDKIQESLSQQIDRNNNVVDESRREIADIGSDTFDKAVAPVFSIRDIDRPEAIGEEVTGIKSMCDIYEYVLYNADTWDRITIPDAILSRFGNEIIKVIESNPDNSSRVDFAYLTLPKSRLRLTVLVHSSIENPLVQVQVLAVCRRGVYRTDEEVLSEYYKWRHSRKYLS